MKYVNLEYHPCDSRIKVADDDIAQTLNSRMGTGGGNVPLILEKNESSNTNRIWKVSGIRHKRNAQKHIWRCRGGSETLIVNAPDSENFVAENCNDIHNCSSGLPHESAVTRSVCADCNRLQRSTYDFDNWGGGEQDSEVRRLTPLECERLQGFPDGWTDIGEWTDSKGKTHKESDAPRYKALGNSIALPFWQYLARRICAQYERDITMGSLFDGIGGFPLVFEKCGAKAVWASEIEEFPIAVTKKHFPDNEDN